MLRRRVSGDIRRARFPCDGCDVDDATPALLDHRRKNGAREIKSAREIDFKVALPEFVAGLDERRALGDASVVDEDVNRPQTLSDIGQGKLDALSVGNVA